MLDFRSNVSGGVKGCEWESLSNALSANSEITALEKNKRNDPDRIELKKYWQVLQVTHRP